MTTSNADLKKSHKYYKKKVNDIEEERSVDRSSEMGEFHVTTRK